jgi:hypothetical protein
MRKAIGCCFYGIPPHAIAQLVGRLRQKPFNPHKVTFGSLARDSATDTAIGQSRVLSRIAKDSSTSLGSPADVLKLIRSSSGNTLVLLGHREGPEFVVRNADGNVAYSVGIAEMHAHAREHGTALIALGCETAKAIDFQTSGLGVVTKFNTVKATALLEKAIAESTTLADFFEKLTDNDLRIVASEHVLTMPSGERQAIPKARIYSKMQALARHIEVATAYVLGQGSEFGLSEVRTKPRKAASESSERDRAIEELLESMKKRGR